MVNSLTNVILNNILEKSGNKNKANLKAYSSTSHNLNKREEQILLEIFHKKNNTQNRSGVVNKITLEDLTRKTHKKESSIINRKSTITTLEELSLKLKQK
ncbi:hypothetical protein TR13x_08685 [Caloranaerobacter sp. TR13]|uniref:hypothetical protein n=1 Tax=Caloranaerobacter TaxID=171003 RepID=UPI0006D413DD|nr:MULTISPECIES: hypothetical protein [Caloranaerobacter]KPU26735.1 hypothetical protein TR13x_08685 [Caloranaerobacter sp. TR13]